MLWDNCSNVYFDPYIDSSNLPFCRDSSIVCHQANSYISNPTDFCKALGYNIDTTENCFRGEFKVGTKYDPIPRPIIETEKTQPEQLNAIFQQFLYDELPYVLLFLFAGLVLWFLYKFMG